MSVKSQNKNPAADLSSLPDMEETRLKLLGEGYRVVANRKRARLLEKRAAFLATADVSHSVGADEVIASYRKMLKNKRRDKFDALSPDQQQAEAIRYCEQADKDGAFAGVNGLHKVDTRSRCDYKLPTEEGHDVRECVRTLYYY